MVPSGFDKVNGCRIRLGLYTLTGPVQYEASERLILNGVDAVVFVADSQEERIGENVRLLQRLYQQLKGLGFEPDRVPCVFQFNKRDFDNAASISTLRDSLSIGSRLYIETQAKTGLGVVDVLNAIVEDLHSALKEERLPTTHSCQQKGTGDRKENKIADPSAGKMMYASTEALAANNHPEIVVAWDPMSVGASPVIQLIESMYDMVTSGTCFKSGHTIQYGWMALHLIANESGSLEIWEPNPEIGPEDRNLVSEQLQLGATRTITISEIQKKICSDVGIDFMFSLVPSQRDGVTVCSQMREAKDLILFRHKPPDESPWSGWFVGCDGYNHDHQNDRYEPVSLFDLVAQRPELLKFFALPYGSHVNLRYNGTFDLCVDGLGCGTRVHVTQGPP
jgi:signal recognition particle receptor subunit beta